MDLREARWVLAEGRAKTPAQLPDHVGVAVISHHGPRWINVRFIDLARAEAPGDYWKTAHLRPKGELAIRPAKEYGEGLPSSNGWEVTGSTVEPAGQGWGRILYQVAAEVASIVGGGIMADRFATSGAAHRMWDKMWKSGKYRVGQLDNEQGELTPQDPTDDAEQTSARDWVVHGGQWHKQPEAKLYRARDRKTMLALHALGKLRLHPPGFIGGF